MQQREGCFLGEFANKVFDVVKRIPRGKVATYGQVACMIGSPRSARYVGFVLRTNPEPANPEREATAEQGATSKLTNPECLNPEPARPELANPEQGASAGEIPCHRVVFKDGHLCHGYVFGGPNVQKRLLEQEGVTFADSTHVDLRACLWDGCD